MLNCDGKDIAFGPNSSQMYYIFSEGLQLKSGDNVIFTDTTSISIVYAWDIMKNEEIIYLVE
jgi:selenocysteine lyase/cysteine desulfurase